jgi:hypothetical protein
MTVGRVEGSGARPMGSLTKRSITRDQRSLCWKGDAVGFRAKPETVREERDRMVAADLYDQLEDLIGREVRTEQPPKIVGNTCRSWSSSTNRINSRSSGAQTPSSVSPRTVAHSCCAVKCARSATNAAWTPHSYAQPDLRPLWLRIRMERARSVLPGPRRAHGGADRRYMRRRSCRERFPATGASAPAAHG